MARPAPAADQNVEQTGRKRGATFLVRDDPPLTKAFGVTRSAPAGSEYYLAMQIATGKVIDGKVVVDGIVLPEGTVVTIFAKNALEALVEQPTKFALVINMKTARAPTG